MQGYLVDRKGEVKQETKSSPSVTPTVIAQTDQILGKTATQEASVEKNQQEGENVLVKKVIDGDTIELENGQKVRYIGINTPEIHHPTKKVECFGQEAYAQNKTLLEGKTLRLEKDVSEKDRYGRLLRYVYIDNLFINDYLVRQGYAYSSTFPPDVKYQQQFRLAEQEAKENNRGLWRAC